MPFQETQSYTSCLIGVADSIPKPAEDKGAGRAFSCNHEQIMENHNNSNNNNDNYTKDNMCPHLPPGLPQKAKLKMRTYS